MKKSTQTDSVTAKIYKYIQRYETLTGKKPGGIPITEQELDLLKEEVKPFLIEREETEDNLMDKEYQVNQFGGIDLYFVQNGEKLRDI